MSTTLSQSCFMTLRHLRTWPASPGTSPSPWSSRSSGCCCSGRCSSHGRDPRLRGDSYLDFLAPGVVVMTAAFSSGWAGMGFIDDLDRGVIDRFLVSPVSARR